MRVLRETVDDVPALLTRAVLDIAFARGFESGLWVQLYRLNVVDLEYATFAALILELAGSPTSEEFAGFLERTRTALEAEESLRLLRQGGGKLLGQWSNRVRMALNGTEEKA